MRVEPEIPTQLGLPGVEPTREHVWSEQAEALAMTLARFAELVEVQVAVALERSGCTLDERTIMSAALRWVQRGGREHEALTIFYAISRACGVESDPLHARLAGAALLAYVATELERVPDVGPWALARDDARRAARRELLRMATRLAQGSPALMELVEAQGQVLSHGIVSGTRAPALELVCVCAGLAAGASDELIDCLAGAGDASARVSWWLEDLQRLLRELTRDDFECLREGPALRLFAAVSTFEQREELEALLEDLPWSSASLHEFFYRSGFIAQCAQRLEEARRELHEQLAEVVERSAASGRARAGLRSWLVRSDGLAAHLYRPPPLECSAALRRDGGAWTQLVEGTVDELCERLAQLGSGERPLGILLPRPRLQAWGEPRWSYDPMRATLFYPDLDGMPEELEPRLAELLAADREEVRDILEGLAPALLVPGVVQGWRDALGLHERGRAWEELWRASEVTAAYLQRFEPALSSVAQRVVDHVLASHPQLLHADTFAFIRAALAAELHPSEAGAGDRERDELAPALQAELDELLASVRGLPVQLLLICGLHRRPRDIEVTLRCRIEGPDGGASSAQPAANEPPPRQASSGVGEGEGRSRTLAWAGGISAACEQVLIELCPRQRWRKRVRACLARGEGRQIELWAELADELGYDLAEASVRGALNYVELCRFRLVNALRAESAALIDRREAPLVLAALSDLSAHLYAHANIDPDDRVEATRLLALARQAQWRENHGEIVDARSWWELGEALAGARGSASMLQFLSGVIPAQRAIGLGHSLGVLLRVEAELAHADAQLGRLGPRARMWLIERARDELTSQLGARGLPEALRQRFEGFAQRLEQVRVLA